MTRQHGDVLTHGDGAAGDERAAALALAIENAELRQQLAEVQDQCIELAVDAGELHGVIEDLQQQLAAARAELETWRGGNPG